MLTKHDLDYIKELDAGKFMPIHRYTNEFALRMYCNHLSDMFYMLTYPSDEKSIESDNQFWQNIHDFRKAVFSVASAINTEITPIASPEEVMNGLDFLKNSQKTLADIESSLAQCVANEKTGDVNDFNLETATLALKDFRKVASFVKRLNNKYYQIDQPIEKPTHQAELPQDRPAVGQALNQGLH